MKTNIPSFLYISTAKVHDVNILDLIPLEVGSFYVVDMGYIDYQRLYRIHNYGSFFVTRAKDNMRFKRMYSRKVDKKTGVLSDQIGKLETYLSSKHYPEKLRRIRYYDEVTKMKLIFITNNTTLDATEEPDYKQLIISAF